MPVCRTPTSRRERFVHTAWRRTLVWLPGAALAAEFFSTRTRTTRRARQSVKPPETLAVFDVQSRQPQGERI